MTNPKVSVIVPVYNVAQYLGECLNSLINQTLKDIEIICIDDKSTDNSTGILKEYEKKDDRIKVICNEVNLSTGASRNKGLEMAKGEYIGFIDSDDWVSLDFYECLYNRAKEEKADVSATSMVINYYSKDKQIKFITNLDKKKYVKSIKEKGLALYSSLSTCNKIFSKKFFEKYNMKHGNNSYAEDINFSVPGYILSNKIAISDIPIYFYRQNREGSALTGLKDLEFISPLINNIKTCYDILEKSNINFLSKIAWRDILNKRFEKDLFLGYNRIKSSQKIDFLNLINTELQNLDIKNLIKKDLCIQQFKIILIILLEILTLKKIKKITFLRQNIIEKAYNLKVKIKILNSLSDKKEK